MHCVQISSCSAGEWKRDTKYGFGVYYYINGDVYEGSWKKNLRHGMGSYLYASTNTKFMGTWIKDRMQGPGQLIHPRHRFHGFWELNLVRNFCEIMILSLLKHCCLMKLLRKYIIIALWSRMLYFRKCLHATWTLCARERSWLRWDKRNYRGDKINFSKLIELFYNSLHG